jgi:hypothetical protein
VLQGRGARQRAKAGALGLELPVGLFERAT